jgi:hypothetical protein
MASQGANSPGTITEITDGATAWDAATLDNAKTSNDSYAIVLLGAMDP